jgi:glycosyltransferase involved in cell wall biosynthesis
MMNSRHGGRRMMEVIKKRMAQEQGVRLSEMPLPVHVRVRAADGHPADTGVHRVVIIGNHLPRQCGIATFTTDLCEALDQAYPDHSCSVLPVNDIPGGYSYPERVRFEVDQDDLATYTAAADFLNINNIDVVCLQHEYGIFGGPAGSHILALLRDLRMPLVTTLHTILREPDAHQRNVLEEIIGLSDRVVVMTGRAAEFLREIYGAPAAKIDIIPHGIPDVPFVDPNFYKDQFGLEGKKVLLTFGLLSPNKGIEHVIEALPAVIERHPDVVYVVVGATHPHVRRNDKESYRLSLQRLARARGVDRHVVFHGRFVTLEELTHFLGAADIYITPYLNAAQIVSGTLAYAVGAGKAVISTPYWHAEELLADGRGLLVPFRDGAALASRIIGLLDDEVLRHSMRKRAYLFTRDHTWPKVARAYMRTFARAREERLRSPRPVFVAATLADRRAEFPQVKLDHLLRLTDSTGMLQHAVFTVPNYNEGYSTDDNARAVIFSLLARNAGITVPGLERYLAFLWHAFERRSGRFRNFLSYDHRWLEPVGSEDSHGRALWALGMVLGRLEEPGLRGLAGRLFDMALPAAASFSSPRAWAFTLLGCHEYLKRFSGDRAAQSVRNSLASRLVRLYAENHSSEWEWFEEVVSYSNATLPQALLATGSDLRRDDLVEAGLRTLQWLNELQVSEGDYFLPIGSNGFYRRGGERARFDQQPVEAGAMVSACLDAAGIANPHYWRHAAQRAFEWFLGRNDLQLSLYDPSTGGCRDGLHSDRANENQGAEATLAFLTALVEMREGVHVLDSKCRSTAASR